MQPLVSVLVPAYNHAHYIAATLASVAEQDYPRVEVLVLDDGSRDETAAVAEAFLATHAARFERTRVWRQPNAGVTRTVNRLYDDARGDLAMLIASDDLLLPGAVRLRVDALAAAPDALALFTDCVVVDGRGERLFESGIRDLYGGSPEALATNRALAATLFRRWCVPGGVLTLRREAFETAGAVGRLDEALVVEDYDLYLRLALTGRLRFDPTPTSAYRLHDGQTIRTLDDVMPGQMAYVLDKVAPRAPGLAGILMRQHQEWETVQRLPRAHPRRLWFATRRRAAWAAHRQILGRPPFDDIPDASVRAASPTTRG